MGLEAEPLWDISSGEMHIRNYGDVFYYPSPELQEGLEELIIFRENSGKGKIPNGSVWVYAQDTAYRPEILGSDVGCGITAFVTEYLPFQQDISQDLLKAVDELNTHIGQGNHFLDFTTGHPLSEVGSDSMIYLHSDFNTDNSVPSTYAEAKELEKQGREGRYAFLDQLCSLLGIQGDFYRDWMHNSVTPEGDGLVYRKGAIDVRETQNIGALALNPFEGMYLYASDWENYRGSMQHGVGRIAGKGSIIPFAERREYGTAKGLLPNGNIPPGLGEVYNTEELFFDQFFAEQKGIGYCIPELVVSTK